MPTAQDIANFSALIADRFHPDKIILFGSYAYGEPSKDSDVDLLVVMSHQESAREMAFRVKSELPRPFPLDLLVRSEDELNARLNQNDFFIREVVERGKVLYEARD